MLSWDKQDKRHKEGTEITKGPMDRRKRFYPFLSSTPALCPNCLGSLILPDLVNKNIYCLVKFQYKHSPVKYSGHTYNKKVIYCLFEIKIWSKLHYRENCKDFETKHIDLNPAQLLINHEILGMSFCFFEPQSPHLRMKKRHFFTDLSWRWKISNYCN